MHRLSSIATALALVAAGEGIAVIPWLPLSRRDNTDLHIVDVGGFGTRRIALRTRSHNADGGSPLRTAVIDLLHGAVAELTASKPE